MTTLAHLELTHFRNYQKLQMDFPKRLTLLRGDNAQGKTNLLEAVYLLSTSKPVHAQMEREVVDWQAQDEPIPFCRVAAQVRHAEASAERMLDLEIVYAPRADGANFTKQVKINGVNKRSMDLIGLLRSVLFLPEDVKLVDGSPSERRRYIDIALCQIDRTYCRELGAYQKVVTQRNSLLKSLRESGASAASASVDAQLGFWDAKLVQHGAHIVSKRLNYIHELDQIARQRHADLTDQGEVLYTEYLPSFNISAMDEGQFRRWKDGSSPYAEASATRIDAQPDEIESRFMEKLTNRRAREIPAGVTLYGPHRDDLRFLADGRDLRTYGSRGQQRSTALSLKLAEVQAMTEATGTPPLLLLDDVMSELDAQRRSRLLEALDGVEQAIVTATDWDDFSTEFRREALCMTVVQGMVRSPNAEEN